MLDKYDQSSVQVKRAWISDIIRDQPLEMIRGCSVMISQG